MKKVKIILLIFLCLFLYNITDVKAYSKQDIINISYNINSCSSRTRALINGYRASYQRLLNERNVSQKNLDKIYNNISQAIKILNTSGLCSVDQKSSVDSATKTKLYDLYEEANELLVNSPMISDNKKTESKVVIDSSTKEIKIYQGGALSDVIKLEEKLNYVGINKLVYLTIILLLLSLVVLVVLKIKKKKNFYLNGIIYVVVLGLFISICFRDKISLAFDAISLMKVENRTISKKIITDGKNIISYPLYGDKYGKISLLNNSEDILFGDSSDILKKGIGQASMSMMPGEGKTILSGHNTGLFSKLFDLKTNNSISIETIYGKFTYSVSLIETIEDTNVEALYKDYDLILYTCSPKGNIYGNKRIIVYAKLIKSEWIGVEDET